jgi:uncharacterized protein
MTKFYIHAESWNTNDKKVFVYDNEFSTIKNEDGSDIKLDKFVDYKSNMYRRAQQFSQQAPIIGKSTSPKKLKIQLGLKCNYSCEYCNQSLHVGDSVDGHPSEVDALLEKLNLIDLSSVKLIEFWGGEPLVYWKTLKPLAIALKNKYPSIGFLMITNGSLLNKEIIDFIVENDFAVAISHDGPGQHIRGPDPFEDPTKMRFIKDLFQKLHPLGRISFNSILTVKNNSRLSILKFFQKALGDKTVKIGEGAVLDVYSSGGQSLSFYDYQDMIQFRRNALGDIDQLPRDQVHIVESKIISFISSVVNSRNWGTLGQKCGMDQHDSLAIDVYGNVLTCQNVSADSKAFNSMSHKIGHISKLDDVVLNTGTHWSLRGGCQKCPVLHLCGGSCFMLEGANWQASCDNAYNDNIVFFMYAFEILTGYLPYYIEGDLPEWRKDILGMDKPDLTRKRKVIPINII